MRLVIAEKPSVAAALAAALGVKNKKDGYMEGGGYLISWCVGHLVQLAEAAAYGSSTKSGAMTACRSCRSRGNIPYSKTGKSSSKS